MLDVWLFLFPYKADNKGADLTAHMRRQICPFVYSDQAAHISRLAAPLLFAYNKKQEFYDLVQLS